MRAPWARRSRLPSYIARYPEMPMNYRRFEPPRDYRASGCRHHIVGRDTAIYYALTRKRRFPDIADGAGARPARDFLFNSFSIR